MAHVDPPFYGAAYYPEDWPLEQIDEDVALMREAGMNVMRIGEFAWSRMEPSQGEYDLDWLHLVVEKLGAAGIGVIMCTPTCTPPAWLTEQYPETRIMLEDGSRAQHGARRHGCPNSPIYRDFTTRIVTRLAKEFGRDKRVVGWQIDNELYISGSARGCCCPVCHAKFHQALRERYGSIRRLNAAWGTDLWSQTYSTFEQIPIPLSRTWHHPSLLTAWMEFQSDSYIEYAELQANILHQLVDAPVGTDMMPFGGLHYYKMHRKLDVVQYNHYDDMTNLWRQVFWMDYVRPIKPRPFWVTETQTCWAGSIVTSGYREPGFCRANSWMPIALGGEANLYWLWRTHWSGQELMHGAVLTSAGRPRHIMGEVKEIAKGFQDAAIFLNNTPPKPPKLAVHFSCWAWWLFQFQPQKQNFNYLDALQSRIYRPLCQAQLRADAIDPMADLDKYSVIVSPFLPALAESGLEERLHRWIAAGGTWIVGPLSDNRNLDAAKFTHAPFGVLEQWTGARAVYEFPGDPRDFNLLWSDGREGKGSIWYDALEPGNAQVLAKYTEVEMAGFAAITRSALGEGQIIWLGTLPQPEDFQRLLLSICREAAIEPTLEASPNLLVVPRGDAGLAVVEYEHQPATLGLPAPARDLLTGNRFSGAVDVPPYGVMVLVYE